MEFSGAVGGRKRNIWWCLSDLGAVMVSSRMRYRSVEILHAGLPLMSSKCRCGVMNSPVWITAVPGAFRHKHLSEARTVE